MFFKFLLLVAMMFSVACNYAISKKGGPGSNSAQKGGAVEIIGIDDGGVVVRMADGTEKTILKKQVDYQLIGPAVIGRYCISCHGGGGSAPSFDGYVKAKKWAASMLGSIKSGKMPPSGSPPPSEAATAALEMWIMNQLPETASAEGPKQPEPDPNKPGPDTPGPSAPSEEDFSKIRDDFLKPFCFECHEEAFSKYSEVVKRVMFKNELGSSLYTKVDGGDMPPFDASVQMTEGEQREMLKALSLWIRGERLP